MKRLSFTCLLIVILALLNGCSKEDPAMITISEGSIEYFQNRMDFSSEGGSKTIQFSTNKNWEISVSESGMGVDWCTVSPKSGTAGNVTLTITVPENSTYGERSVILTLTAENVTEKLRVTQKQNDAILLSASIFEVPMDGDEIKLEVKSNVSYQVEIPEQYKGWIHKGTKTRALESNNMNFVVDKNEDYEKRQGEIIISDGNITEVVKVYQAGGGILVLSQNEYNVPSDGGSVTVDLSSNFEYDFELPNVDWIKLNDGTRGMSSHTVHFDVMPNDGYDNRSADIRFYDPKGNVSETVTVNQAQKDILLIHNSYKTTLSYKKQTFELKTLSNVSFDVQSNSEWITCHQTRGLNEASILLDISENNTTDNRSGKVILKNDSLKYSITISQYGLPFDLSSNGTANSYIVPPKDAYFSIDASVAGNDRSHRLIGGTKAFIVWEDYNCLPPEILIDNLEYDSKSGTIIFRAKNIEGNVLIALCDNNENIIWSWHLWLTDYNPDVNFITFSNGTILMDRYLGAASDERSGLYYQWGRKDPFVSNTRNFIEPDETTGSIKYSIMHPDIFISGNYDDLVNWDWNYEHTARWSSKKSIYDPCPPGWKVMDETCIPSLVDNCIINEDIKSLIIGAPYCTPQTKFKYTSYIDPFGGGNASLSIWTNRGTYHGFYTALGKYFNRNQKCFEDQYIARSFGLCIRCQREN